MTVRLSQPAARVYAKALFDIAVESDSDDRVTDDLHAVRDAIGGLDPHLRGFFEMPQLRREDQRRVVNAAFEGNVSRPVLGLLNVLVEKRRGGLLDAIVAEFDHLLDERAGRVQATVTSARELGADVADALQAALEQRTQRQVVLNKQVDPNVLGGIRVNLGDRVIDGTLRKSLSDMRRVFAASQA